MDEYGAGGTDPNLHDTFAVLWVHDGDIYQVPWGHARDGWYGVSAYPEFQLDGLGDAGWPYTLWEGAFLARQAIPTDVTIQLFGDQVSDATFDITLDVCVEEGGTGKDMSIYIVQVLDNYPASPSYYRNCVMQAADEPHGTEPVVTLAPGECETIIRTMTFDAVSWEEDHRPDIKIIAWAQEDNASPPAEVYQAAIMPWPFPQSVALRISLPNGVPEYIPAEEPTDIAVQIEDSSEVYVPDSALLHYRFDGGTFLTVPLTSLGDDLYEGTLPSPACDDTPEFYVSAEGDEGTTIYSPEDAPASVYSAQVGTVTMLLEDDFELDLGWTVENDPSLTDGAWERAVPGMDADRGAPPEDYDGSGYCYVTDDDYRADVDYGPTHLISDVLDMSSATTAILRFAYWWSNDDQDGDAMDVAVSNDDGDTWIPVMTISDQGYPVESWTLQDINVGIAIDPAPLTSEMRVRFSVSDPSGSPSIDEGGIDGVEIFQVDCGLACPWDLSGNGVVDPVDVGIVKQYYGCAVGTGDPACDQADLSGNGDVDPVDVGVVKQNYGPCP